MFGEALFVCGVMLGSGAVAWLIHVIARDVSHL